MAKIVTTLVSLILVPSWIVTTSADNELEKDLDTWEAPPEFSKKLPFIKSGYDDDNRPIWITPFGKWDARSIVEEGESGQKMYEKYSYYWAHQIRKSIEDKSTPENPVTGIVMIVDFDGYSLRQFGSVQTVTFLLRLVPVTFKVFERMDYGFMVNLNFVAESFINVARPLFGSLLQNFDISGTNRAKWLPKILNRIPRDRLPESYGGFSNFTAVKYYGGKT